MKFKKNLAATTQTIMFEAQVIIENLIAYNFENSISFFLSY